MKSILALFLWTLSTWIKTEAFVVPVVAPPRAKRFSLDAPIKRRPATSIATRGKTVFLIRTVSDASKNRGLAALFRKKSMGRLNHMTLHRVMIGRGLLMGFFALVAGGFPRTVWAQSATLNPTHNLRHFFIQNAKLIRRSIVALILSKLLWDQLQVKLRQRLDATSEWGRYARNPGARGRALIVLVFLKVLPLYMLSRIPFLRSSWKDKILEYSGNALTNGLLQVGPLYVKLGQIISSRDDIVPSQWVKALERLQDQVPARKGQEAYELAYEVWPGGRESFEDTFSDFDATPLAAASLGQVHLGVLRSNNDTVAVKLQRPFLRKIYDQDFVLLTNIAGAVDRFGGSAGQVGGVEQSWKNIFEDAEKILYCEIDYRDEAANGVRICRDFGIDKGGKSVPSAARSRDNQTLPSAASWLRVPFVYDDISSEKALVMEFVPSIKVTKLDKLKEAGVTMRDREYLADCLGRAYLRQFCCNLFFSTDPHAGNLGVEVLDANATSPEKRVRLVLYDFGQAAELNRNQADGILDVIEAIVDSDVDKSLASFEKMGVLKENADIEKVRAKVADNFKTGKVKANRKRLSQRGYKFAPPEETNTTEAPKKAENSTAADKATKHGRGEDKAPEDSEVMQFFSLPAEYAFVARALSQMDGVGKVLDPEFDFVSAGAPWIVEIKGTKQYLRDEANKWLSSLEDRVRSILPTYVDNPKNTRRFFSRV